MGKRKSGKSARRGKSQKAVSKSSPEDAAPSVSSMLSLATPDKIRSAKRRYFDSVITRGEAVPAGQPLCPGATHVIVGKDEEGKPELTRKRFSLVRSKQAATKKRPARKKK